MSDGIGSFLSTQPISVDVVDLTPLPPAAEGIDAVLPTSPPTSQVSFCFLDCPDPLVIAQQEFVLGRTVKHDRSMTIDLSPYRGYALGVSRHHAVIVNTTEGCTIKDLGSANGTWLNGTRLASFVPYPLVDGDNIQLGHLTMTIHFVSNKSLSN